MVNTDEACLQCIMFLRPCDSSPVSEYHVRAVILGQIVLIVLYRLSVMNKAYASKEIFVFLCQ